MQKRTQKWFTYTYTFSSNVFIIEILFYFAFFLGNVESMSKHYKQKLSNFLFHTTSTFSIGSLVWSQIEKNLFSPFHLIMSNRVEPKLFVPCVY